MAGKPGDADHFGPRVATPGERTTRARPLTRQERRQRGYSRVVNRADLECACGGLLCEDEVHKRVFCLSCEPELAGV